MTATGSTTCSKSDWCKITENFGLFSRAISLHKSYWNACEFQLNPSNCSSEIISGSSTPCLDFQANLISSGADSGSDTNSHGPPELEELAISINLSRNPPVELLILSNPPGNGLYALFTPFTYPQISLSLSNEISLLNGTVTGLNKTFTDEPSEFTSIAYRHIAAWQN